MNDPYDPQPISPGDALGPMPRPMPPNPHRPGHAAAHAGFDPGLELIEPSYPDQPTPTPRRPAPPPPARDRVTAWKLFVWFALLLVVAGIVVLQHTGPDVITWIFGESDHQRAEAEQEKQRQRYATDTTPSDFALRFHGRLAVGLKRLSQAQRTGSRQQRQQDEQLRGMVEQTDQFAGTITERLRVAVLAGEVVSAEEATDRLDQLQGDLIDEPPAPEHQAVLADIDALRTVYDDGPQSLTDEQRERLIERHQWFGELAVTHGLKPAESDLRKQAVAVGTRTMIGMIVFMMVVGVAGLVGLVLLILAIVFTAKGKMWRGYWPDRQPHARRHVAFLEMIVIFLLGVPALSVLAQLLSRSVSDAIATQIVWLLLLTPLWLRLRGVNWRRIRAALGWHSGRGVMREVGCGFVGYVAALPLMFVGMIGTFILMTLTQLVYEAMEKYGEPGPPPGHPMVAELASASLWEIALLFALACMWAPIVEETLFRGAFQHYLRRRWSIPLTTLLVAFIFAVIHPQGYIGVPLLTSVGVALSLIREWRGSLIAPIVTHACVNGVTLTMVLLLFR